MSVNQDFFKSKNSYDSNTILFLEVMLKQIKACFIVFTINYLLLESNLCHCGLLSLYEFVNCFGYV